MTVHPRMFRTEFRYASMLIGLLAVVWAAAGVVQADDLFFRALHALGVSKLWFVGQLGIGTALIVASIIPCRKLLHAALSLSVFVWFAGCSAFILRGVVTPLTIVMPVLAIVSLALLVEDVRRKPRGC